VLPLSIKGEYGLLADQASHLKIFAHQVERWFAWSASKEG